ncbi:17-beta-hydroxysteroid dehydrogenase type 6-like [Ruditapes philippinarum]|uniref:17-beta-hydroxysteroid dehydrogenase type 6-like n=1 Tax=Ruditapes philippinarum TaxID=129788 RepID=UPI00295B68F0|nr:17-beta-hydroxysteroid dehydrogenase type 6-like [Ruditapes philippinarum]
MLWSLVSIVLTLLALKLFMRVLNKIKISDYKGRYVLVTGCDSGFGYLLTKRLDLLGFNVFAGCLTKAGVENIRSECSEKVTAVQLDVSNDDNINAVAGLVKKKLKPDQGLWAVVNNAGIIGSVGPTSWQTREDYEKTMSVNLYGVIMVTKTFMPLVQKGKGRIINTASVLGRIAFVSASYCISKYGVEAFSDVLRQEMYGSDVSVHIIEPGFYRTALLDRELFERKVETKITNLPKDIKETLPVNLVTLMGDGFERLVKKVASSNVHEVVDAYINAITSRFPRKRYLIGFDANYIFRPLSILPEFISDWVLKKIT